MDRLKVIKGVGYLKVDIVLPWVDEKDSEWQRERLYYQKGLGLDKESNGHSRYRDYGTLKYVFRSIEKFCPWIGRIFFVTANNQKPQWLDVDNPKLVCIDHRDFIPSEYLPTFNSSIITTNAYRIKGLSSRFILMNDDFFFNAPMNEENFFVDELPVYSNEFDVIHPMGNTFSHIVLNNLELVAKHYTKKEIVSAHFNKFYNFKGGLRTLIKNILLAPYKDLIGFKNIHLPLPLLKESCSQLVALEKEAFSESFKNKFRNLNDLNEWSMEYWQICQGKFIPMNAKKIGAFYELTNIDAITEDLRSSKHKMLCLNDVSNLDDSEFKVIREKLLSEMANKLSNKSSFEK